MTIVEALESLGVHDGVLSAGEREFLDEQGYLPLPGILTTAEAAAFRGRLVELAEAEGESAGLDKDCRACTPTGARGWSPATTASATRSG